MRTLFMVGVSHRSAPLRALERLTPAPELVPGMLDHLLRAGAREAVLLSTCSRTEIYVIAGRSMTVGAVIDVFGPQGPDLGELSGAWVQLRGREAAHHLLRVAAGLESRVAGEVEIQGQVRAAARLADAHGALGPTLRGLFDAAAATARRAHRDTALGRLGRSLGRAGVDAGIRDLDGGPARIAVVGTGHMAKVASERLQEHGLEPVVYARSPDGALRLTADRSRVRRMDQLRAALPSIDVVICATSSPAHLLTAADVRTAGRASEERTLTLVDLGVPRNIDPGTRHLPGVRLIDLEDLTNGHTPPEDAVLASALEEAAAIVRAGLRRWEAAHHRRVAGPTIARLHHDMEQACRALYQRRPELADGPIDPAARATSRRMVHQSIGEVLAAVDRGDAEAVEQIYHRLTDSLEQASTGRHTR